MVVLTDISVDIRREVVGLDDESGIALCGGVCERSLAVAEDCREVVSVDNVRRCVHVEDDGP